MPLSVRKAERSWSVELLKRTGRWRRRPRPPASASAPARPGSGAIRREGQLGLCDRSSAPETVFNRTDERRIETIGALRRLRMTGAEIAECLEMAPSTVSGILTRIGLGKLSSLEPPEPPNRYERARPGELVHIDVKKLGRIDRPGHRAFGRGPGRHSGKGRHGWECVHVCVDDATRLAYVEVLADEKATSAIGFLKRALGFYRAHGVSVERVMTENGSAYRSSVHAIACRALGLKHLRTRPYRPRTKRQSRAFHPHDVGRRHLQRADLSKLERAHRGARRVA